MKPAFRQLARKYGAWTALTVLALLPAIVHADPPVPLAYVLSDLGTVPGTTGNSFGSGVNDKGIVTGGGVFDTSGGPTTAFISGPNGASPLKPLEGSPGGFGYEGGVGINASGQVTGWDYTADGSPRAFLFDPNGGTLPTWPEWIETDPYLGIDAPPAAGSGVRTAQCDFWDTLL